MTRSADTKTGGFTPVGLILDGDDWEPGDIGLILNGPVGRGYSIADLQVFAAAPDLLEAAREMSAVLSRFGDWEDGCFYYNGKSATELEAPQQRLAAALAKALTPTEEGR